MSETDEKSPSPMKIQVITLEERVKSEVAKFDIAEAFIQEKATELAGLDIAGVEDKGTYKLVDTLRKDIKKKIKEIEDRRKETNADALSFQRSINAYCKKVSEPLKYIMNEAAAKTKIIDEENQRIKDQEIQAKQLKMQGRIEQVVAQKAPLDYIALQKMTDEEFDTHLAKIIADNEAEAQVQARLEQEARIKEEAEAEEKRIQAQAEEKRLAAEATILARKNEAIAEEQRLARERSDRQAEAARKIEEDRLETIRLENQEAQAKLHAEVEQLNAEKAQIAEEKAQLAADKAEIEAQRPEHLAQFNVPNIPDPKPEVQETEDIISKNPSINGEPIINQETVAYEHTASNRQALSELQSDKVLLFNYILQLQPPEPPSTLTTDMSELFLSDFCSSFYGFKKQLFIDLEAMFSHPIPKPQ